jgi:primosomal protein N' (replication factor Y) (superfamily II helicase)
MPYAERPPRAPEDAASSGVPAAVAIAGKVGERSVYTYRIPEALVETIRPGMLVEVPFGPRVMPGIVLSLNGPIEPGIRLRDVVGLLDPLPCLTPSQIGLAEWIAAYYSCRLNDAVALMVPGGIGRAPVVVYSLPSEPPLARHILTELQRELLEKLERLGPSKAARLADGHAVKAVTMALESLARRQLVQRSRMLGQAPAKEMSEDVVVLQPRRLGLRLTPRRQAVVDFLEDQGGEATLREIRDQLHVDRSVLNYLATSRVIVLYSRQARRDPLAHRPIVPNHPPSLTGEQQRVFRSIQGAIHDRDGSIFLLHGVTGSGKTEIYLRAVAETIASGRQAIVLVPEIGLTPQTVDRFAGRFPGQIALLHSKLSDGERFDEWQRIRRGECSIVVGPRSAVFSPFRQVGLIVLDEEHDPSYKQDRTPCYHTREVATRIAKQTGAVVILGSATPDVISYNRADRGDYRLLSMTARVRHPGTPRSDGPLPISTLPPVQVVDMRQELKAGNRSIFSRAMQTALHTTLRRRQQAILFLNRRGHATFVNCRDCGFVVKCLRCDLPFTYHSHEERLHCHRCDARAPVPRLCPKCGSWRIRYFGLGTQKVEQEVRSLVPEARVERYDRDVAVGKFGHEVILDRFARGEIDILIGTQIVAKGLDFPRVTMVGAISADTSINLPDFRASERTFALLTQVAGRAGRAALPGVVVVQTYTPGHFAIQAAANHDYIAFYRDEIRFRREANYPPFSQLVRLIHSSPVEQECREAAELLAKRLTQWIADHPEQNIDLIGPAPCFTGKADNRFFWQILLRGANVHPILPEVPRPWLIDVDPVNLL